VFILRLEEYCLGECNLIFILKAVRPYTLKGKVLCSTIVFLCKVVSIFVGKKWRKPLNFEENPRTMKAKDILYFAYKYYFKPPLVPSSEKIIAHFENKVNVKQYDKKIGQSIEISIGGDLMPYELIKPDNTARLWDDIGADFFGSDIVFANLETPLDRLKKPSFVPEVMLTNMLFNTDEQTFNIFNGNGRFRGYDILSVANNHSLDMGEEGLLHTLDFLTEKNIKYVGAVRSESDFAKPQIIEKNGIKIGFIAYTYSLNQFLPPENKPWAVNYLPLNTPNCNIDLIKTQTLTCKQAGADLVVCSLHAGNAYQIYPNQTTVDLYQRVFNECGVDVIAGGHPHNLQPWKYYNFICPFTKREKQGFAIYSLADFIAYDIFTWCHLSAILKIKISRGEDNEISWKIDVKPLVMHSVKNQLKLRYAEEFFQNGHESKEYNSLKLLYDKCLSCV
jgi:hypothetical protein